MTKLIDGKAIARRIRGSVAAKVKDSGTAPGLATILVGDDPSGAVYVASKRRHDVRASLDAVRVADAWTGRMF
ncbi:hypothetical protein Acsp03_35780 [Actinomadura sp. NBRC 104412]|uniref:tetrahydrofolate dehydrogenase/cyclohydrolase catalytic domain-containing protein n=1 Tax=Actinomadura sp. NBRC 104412 TaxID=3032203 RepID=UPI0024A417EF|nr:tetrahydrofolate dehydrogenase/cyclohydrolase catalytic domain-containing protein [Actinomadura sp. NBRC 104412]GLZ06112.1 hypothetical protein Acsp03_35780 [Actinomadura sp. NBRC 104412]